MNADIDNLLAEVDEHIRFSLNLDSSNRVASEVDAEDRGTEDEDPIAKVKNDLSEVRRDLSALRSDLSTDRRPLMDMMNNFVDGAVPGQPSFVAAPTSPVVKPRDASHLMRRASESPARGKVAENNRRNSSREMEEVEKAMTQLARTISEFHSPGTNRKVGTVYTYM